MRSRQQLTENRKIEWLARTEPDHMLGMVGEIVSGLGMSEDCQCAAIQGEELGDLAKGIARNRQLHACTRVRTYGP